MTRLFFAFVAVLLISPTVQAAGDGALHPTASTGFSNMDLEIPDLVKIGGMIDFEFGYYAGAGNMVLDKDVCVWTNVEAGTYIVTARGDGENSAFSLSHGENVIPYRMYWNDTTGVASNTELLATVASDSKSGASTTSLNCSGGFNANYQVILEAPDLLSVPPGVYSGVLSITIAPAP